MAGVGRFGPYVKHGKIYASLEEGDDVLTVGLNRAMHSDRRQDRQSEEGPPLRRRRRARRSATIPTRAGTIVAKNGRVRALRQQQRHQRHPAGRQDAGDRDARRGHRAARRARRRSRQLAARQEGCAQESCRAESRQGQGEGRGRHAGNRRRGRGQTGGQIGCQTHFKRPKEAGCQETTLPPRRKKPARSPKVTRGGISTWLRSSKT